MHCRVLQDGIQQPKPGEIAYLLHKDMAIHMEKTADFNDGWKVGTLHGARGWFCYSEIVVFRSTAAYIGCSGHEHPYMPRSKGDHVFLQPCCALIAQQRALCVASMGLAVVSLLKAVEKAREGDPGWLERALTCANAGLIAGWVAQVDGQAEKLSLLPTQMVAFALSLYQLVAWWTSRQGGVHVDFPVAVILFTVVVASIASMKSTLDVAGTAFHASGALAEKVSSKRSR